MRVLHVVTAFPRHDDDVITPWLGELLLAQRASGLDARVLAPAYRGGGATRWRGVPVTRFRYAPRAWETLTHDETAPDRLRHRPWYAALLPGYLLGGTVAALRAGRAGPDVVHVHWPMPHAWLGAVARLGSGGRAALVASFYSVELRWVTRRLPLLRPLLRWTIEVADEVTAISSATAGSVQAIARRPVHVIPFAAALAPAADSGMLGDRRAGGPPFEILFVGRLVERKGVEVLLRALALLRRRLDARLTVVGEGSWEARLRATAAGLGLSTHVHFTGRVPDAELRAAYERADVFVLPAVVDAKGDTEGLGVVLLEALRFGLPIVASDAGGIPDIVIEGRTGWLVPPGDVSALAGAIQDALEHPEEAERRTARGRELSARRFSLPQVTRSLTRCYEQAIARRRGLDR